MLAMAPLATEGELACPTHRTFGCECDKLPLCGVCRRRIVDGKCHCESTVDLEPIPEDRNGELVLSMRTPRDRVESTVRLALHLHLSTRDSRALAALVRDLAEKVYLA